MEVDRAKWQWSDDPEGEFDYDTYLLGETECYRTRRKRKHRGGVRVEVAMSFSCNIRAQVIAEYGQFVADVLGTIQGMGSDVEVSIVQSGAHMYRETLRDTTEIEIVVSRFGEQVMIREWSALFSPGGFRHLVFAGMALPERTADRHINAGWGMPQHREWSVKFEDDSRTLKISCDSRSSSFPRDRMESQMRELAERI